jgi:hypothetical protein
MTRDMSGHSHEILNLKIHKIVFERLKMENTMLKFNKWKTASRILPLFSSIPIVAFYINMTIK